MKSKKQGLFNRYSQKKGINLVRHEKEKNAAVTIIIGLLLIGVLCCVVAKFGVIDQYNKLETAQHEYNTVHNQYLSTVDQLQHYDDVLKEYRLYSREWMDADSGDFVSVKRTDILDMVEQYMMPHGVITTISILDNQVSVVMSGMSLTEISNMCVKLEQLDIVASATVTTAQTLTGTGSNSTLSDYETNMNNGKIQVDAEKQSEAPEVYQLVTPANNSDTLAFTVIIQLHAAGEED